MGQQPTLKSTVPGIRSDLGTDQHRWHHKPAQRDSELDGELSASLRMLRRSQFSGHS